MAKRYEIKLGVCVIETYSCGASSVVSKFETIENVRMPERLVDGLEKRLLDHIVTVKNGIKDDIAQLK